MALGATIAKRLAADGASVAITYAKDEGAASAVVKAIELSGGKAIAIQADAADARSNGICAYAARPENGGPILDQSLKRLDRPRTKFWWITSLDWPLKRK